jgi:hypothetical protein
MKKTMLAIMFSLVAAQAQAGTPVEELTCSVKIDGDDAPGGMSAVELKAEWLEDWMADVIVTAVTEGLDGNVTETGRAANLDQIDNSRARKYIDFMKFDLGQLTEVTKFGKYLPGDSCRMSLFIPKKIKSHDSFKAPMVINCDQSGGTVTMKCQIKTVKTI